MPKAAPGNEQLQPSAAGKQAAPSLKRYQACHQCRKRKLKCDAKRPCCSTCVRSHAYAVAHAVEGASLPEHPECTYDEVPVFDSDSGNSISRKMYEKMEHKIHELEALLREKDQALQTLQAHGSPAGSLSNLMHGLGDGKTTSYTMPKYPGESSPASMAGSLDGRHHPSATSPTVLGTAGASPSSVDDFSHVDIRTWPPNLPRPDITRHLVEAFFTYHMHANRMFHVSTFMASLELLPTDPRFPNPAVLHAMCAVGSLYTATPTQIFSEPIDTPYELHQGRWRRGNFRPDFLGEASLPEGFTEQQARYAKQRIEVGLVRGDFACLQAQMILTWWYLSQGRWTDAFLSAALAVRCTAPCSISTCYTTAAITHYKPPSVLAPAKSVIEDEIRRNTFWIAYAMERQQGTGNGWALSLDDLDVCQLLPLRFDQFEQGVLVLPEERQWSYAPDLLYKHPEAQTDSFILYIKASILLSKVKTYNLRFRWKFFHSPDGAPSSSTSSAAFDPANYDATSTVEFQQLDTLVANFRPSFPPHLRSPIAGDGDVIDPYLYTACTAGHLAHILLHEPHAKPDVMTCPSARKTLTAARAIVELMYMLSSTNYDVTLLDLQPFMCWFMAGRVLVRFLRAAIDGSRADQLVPLQSEISFVRTMLSKAGERVPLAYRYAKMLHDTLTNMCGQQFADNIPDTLPPRGYYMAVQASRPMVGNVPHTVEHIVLS